MKKLNIFFEVIVVLAWGAFVGLGASHLAPDNVLFELSGVIAGLSFGILIAWGIRVLTISLKAQRR